MTPNIPNTPTPHSALPIPLPESLPSHTVVIVRHNVVEYRLATAAGVRIVQIFFNTATPRVKAFADQPQVSGEIAIVLSLDEILAYVSHARSLMDALNE